MAEDVKVTAEKPSKTKKTGPWYWLSDTRGEKSITATLVFVSFLVTTFAFLFSTVEKIGGTEFRSFDVAACSAYFVPILTLYFGRRWTDAKLSAKKVLGPSEDPKE
jgi:hypothetical protein